MIEFESYLKSNWNVQDAVSCGTKYTHSTRETKDKKSNETLINNSINITLSWFDKDNNLLRSEKLTFMNDDMNKQQDKKMLTINRKELVNKFRLAKPEIIQKIRDEKYEKLLKIKNEINDLNNYLGRNDDIIPQEMKGSITIKPTTQQTSSSSNEHKITFDM